MVILFIMNKFQPKKGNFKGFIILDFLEEKRALVTVWLTLIGKSLLFALLMYSIDVI